LRALGFSILLSTAFRECGASLDASGIYDEVSGNTSFDLANAAPKRKCRCNAREKMRNDGARRGVAI
jgi:hypothetical protein